MAVLKWCRACTLPIAMGALAFFPSSVLHASELGLYQISRSGFFTQNSTAAPTSADYYEWGVDVDQNTSAFDSGTINYPGGNSVSLNVSSTFMSYLTLESSLASLNTDFATGDYILTAHDSTNTNPDETPTITYAGDAYTNIPAVTSATYSALTGLDPSAAFTANFSPLVTSGAANPASGSILVSIYDSSYNYVVDSFLPASASSIQIPANTLSPNTAYTLFINFSDGVYASSEDVNAIQSFQYGTSIPFTTGTAVPEPAMLGAVMVFGMCSTRRRNGRRD